LCIIKSEKREDTMKSQFNFGKNLKQLLDSRNIKPLHLAEQLNVDHSLVRKWIAGSRVPSLKSNYPKLLCDYLNASQDERCQLKRAQMDSLDEIDITDLEMAYDSLRESEEKHRLLFENSLDPILLTRPDGTILAANPAACDFLHMTEAEICVCGRSGIIDAEDENLQYSLTERHATGQSRALVTYIKKDGTKQRAEMTTALYNDSKGEVVSYVIIRKITFPSALPLKETHADR